MTAKDLEIFREIPTIYTPRLVLRKITHSDIDDIHEYATDMRVSEFLLWDPHKNKEYTRRFVEFIQNGYQKLKYYTWGVEFESKMIGTCGFSAFDLSKNSAEVGYVLSANYWNLGIATEATKRVIEYGFEVLGLSKIEARFIKENTKSRKVAERLGMTYYMSVPRAYTHRTGKRDMEIFHIERATYLKNK